MPNAPRRAQPEQPAPEPDSPAAIDPLAYTWLVAFGMMAIGAITGMLFLHYRNPPEIGPATGFGVFAAVFLLAAAIERLLEALNDLRPLGGDTTADPSLRPHRAALCLGLAAALAMIACGFFGLGVMHAFGDNGAPRYVDVIVTGLGIGAVTKPLHDLIRGIERWSHPRAAGGGS